MRPSYTPTWMGAPTSSTRTAPRLRRKCTNLTWSAQLASSSKLAATLPYDGDRIMGIFIGDTKNTTAAKTALQINWALKNIVNPALKAQYGDTAYQMAHVIGIDTSPMLAARIGVRNDNDIVWVGRAPNYAAKLTAISGGYPIYITGDVFEKLNDSSKYGGDPRRLMWESRAWTKMNNMSIYRSNWHWSIA